MRTDTTICINSKVNGKQPSLEHRIYSIEGVAPALTTGFHYLIGYYEECALGADAPENNLTGGQIYDNSVLDCYNCAMHRDIHTTLTSRAVNSNLYYIAEVWKNSELGKQRAKDMRKSESAECSMLLIPKSKTRRGRVQEAGEVAPTLTTKNNQELLRYEGIDEDMRLRIRRLTERESFRLMGVRDSDTDKIQAYEEPGDKKSRISSTAQYALAGNSIVVDVLAALMEQMFYPSSDSDLLF